MNPLGFARAVLVHALSVRVVGYKDGDGQTRFKIPQAHDLPWVEPTALDDWPGEPVHLDWDLPKGPKFALEPTLNGRVVVRWRRLLLDQPLDGVVLANTSRSEGVLDEDEIEGRRMAGPRRVVNLYQVALRPLPRRVKSLIVFVHPKDLTAIEVQPATRGAPAPSRAGVGGRMGGARA